MRHLFLFILLSATFLGFSQKGTIRGTVYDAETGESLVGVTVLQKGSNNGTVTDLDGKFSLKVEAGTHNIQLSYVSFQTVTIEDVEVKPGEVTVLNDLRLRESNKELEEVTVTAEAIRSSESALTTVKRKSASLMDGISAEKIRKIGDATAAEAVKRVTGVTVEDGKYVYVRGLGDRYSKTMLNHVEIPGLDPDRNTLQMDIFPSALISNIVVNKNFTADMPADFTGGLLNVETKVFPEKKILNASFSTSFNPQENLNPDYLSYDGGSTDFLGFDDGTRALPSRAQSRNIPTPISGASQQEVKDFVSSFSPELAAKRQASSMDVSAGISVGNQLDLKGDANADGDDKLGYIFSLSYKSSYDFYDDAVYSEYQRYIDPQKYEMRYATKQKGRLGEHNVLVGMLGGLAYKNAQNKIRLTALHLQNGKSRAGKFRIDNDRAAVGQSGYIAESDNLEYNQRSLTNVLLHGTHVYKASDWELDWRISPTYSSSEDPDIRKTAFTLSSNDTNFNAGAGGNPSRIWRSLSEINASAGMDATKKYSFLGEDAELKVGMSHTYKQRDYEILFFDMQFFGNQDWPYPDPANVLSPGNIYPNSPNSIYYQSGNSQPNPNAYESNVHNTGIYISNEFKPFSGLKTILGIRAENYVQRHTGRDQSYASGNTESGINLDNEKVLESLDFFPSVNLIYALTERQNLRATYSKTIARPSFKELSFAQIVDPMTNRIFNGSLFSYSNWDGNLTETRIVNIDLRWELFMDKGQMFSASAFYKKFEDPIELVRIPEQQTSTEYQPRNVGSGKVYGLEMEFRKDLDFIAPAFNHFNVNGNLTLVESRIDMTDTEYESRKTYEKEGQNINDTRRMAGQSPYVINAGLTYSNSDLGLVTGAFYNVKGKTLKIVGMGLFPDIYDEPFHSLNFSLSKKIGKNHKTELDFKVSNILNERRESFYQSFRARDRIYNSLNPGMIFSLGVSHEF
ncbi:MAG: TonB-dependent receptor [Bacteroidales bacterium]|nr:TonB-dependent receptor [Bacteroidales bacterium]MCF8338599.1 TonB-dependent receptor [Bacteroidales bacterium]